MAVMTDVTVAHVCLMDMQTGQQVVETAVVYRLDGRDASARLPYAMSAQEARHWIEKRRASYADR